MKNAIKYIFTTVILLTAQFSAAQVRSEQRENSDGYHLIWQDNFDARNLDEKNNWNIVVNGRGGGNRELQYYKRDNIEVGKEPVSGKNCLIITAKKECYWGKPSTSGKVSSQNKISFKYGKIEARIKFPKTGNGLWPAFWMLGHDYPSAVWPKCGEIDIIEMGNSNGIKSNTQDRYFNGACHWGEHFNHGAYPNYAKSTTSVYSLQDEFHLYTLIWDANTIKMYVDLDKYPTILPYYELPIKGENLPDKPARYFQKQFFVVFNLAVGGNFTQIRHINQVTALANGDAKMYVDYVKVFQKGTDDEEYSGPKLVETDPDE